MRVRLLAGLGLAVATVFLAGCIGHVDDLDREVQIVAGAADADETRDGDEYWMVWVRGNETDERAQPFVCTRVLPNYRLDVGDRSVVYSNGSYGFDPDEVRVLVAFDHEDRSSQCSEAEHLVADPEPEHVQEMGEWGELALTVREDGTLVADGHEIELGVAAAFSYEGTPQDPDKLHVDGGFRVEVLGAWPQEKLQEGEP